MTTIKYIMKRSATADGEVYKVGQEYTPKYQDGGDHDPRRVNREKSFLKNYTYTKATKAATTRKRSTKKAATKKGE